MSLSIISSKNLDDEKQIQADLYDAIDNNESIIFSSGAGAGKTYSLIESLKHIIHKYGESLQRHNQKVMCITYTNVASEEVKYRLGKSDLVMVSTIHERVWELIKDYQKELVLIHQTKLKDEIEILENKIKEDDKYTYYQKLPEAQKSSFQEIIISEKDLFYKNYDNNAKEFKEVFEDILSGYVDLLKNVNNFKSLINSIYKLENYSLCLKEISLKKKGYKEITYNPLYNSDRLHWMRISHDTLLEYGFEIIQKHKLLQQILIDKYPYILIDEYQDTDQKVIKIMALLSKHSKEISHNLFIGYFGDPVQNIYDEGVGGKIKDYHPDLRKINKQFNRRSTSEVIGVINNIRNDEINQVSIFEDSKGGSVKFYNRDRDNIGAFIQEYVKEWNITKENKLHCFVLTNKSIASYSGFENIYFFFSGTKKYKKDFQQLNTELLSDDKSKLGKIPILLFRIMEFKNKLRKSDTPVQEIIYKDIYEGLNIELLRDLFRLLKEIEGDTLKGLLVSISRIYEKTDSEKFKLLIDALFDFEGFPTKSFSGYIMECLYQNNKSENAKQVEEEIDQFLSLNLSEFDLWYKYILREIDKKIVYHTYHGTKGLEFDNVIIIMENSFGRDRNYFKNYFLQLTSDQKVSEPYDEKFDQTKNLLYVACSRAIKNLRVLYLDDISEFKTGIERVFIEVEA